MDWKIFHQWNSFLIQTQYKETIIDRSIREFRQVLSDQSSNIFVKNLSYEDRNNITDINWHMYGKINNLLDKIYKIYSSSSEKMIELDNFNLSILTLPRMRCKTSQKYQKKIDINEGKMYNISAEYNGIDTNDKDTYFYIPIHKTRRHVHGVPKEFLINYIYNMIESASWEKNNI